MNSLEEINIWWEGPFSQDEIIEDKIDDEKYETKATDIGLYQIYGNHILYGNDVLLYIGLTLDSFKSRLKDRWIIDNNNDTENIKIYLGTIYSHKENIKNQEKEKIKKAEALIINTLKPALNSSYINSVATEKMDNKEFVVYNYNSYRSLHSEISTKRWWFNNHLNYNIVDTLAKELDQDTSISEVFYGFDLKENDNICFGVDYAYWNKEKFPLVIGVFKESINKSKLEKKFNNIGEDEEYYFVSASDDLKAIDVIDKIKDKLIKIKAMVK